MREHFYILFAAAEESKTAIVPILTSSIFSAREIREIRPLSPSFSFSSSFSSPSSSSSPSSPSFRPWDKVAKLTLAFKSAAPPPSHAANSTAAEFLTPILAAAFAAAADAGLTCRRLDAAAEVGEGGGLNLGEEAGLSEVRSGVEY